MSVKLNENHPDAQKNGTPSTTRILRQNLSRRSLVKIHGSAHTFTKIVPRRNAGSIH